MTTISRAEFISRYQAVYDRLFCSNALGECLVKNLAAWEVMEFSQMTITGWSADAALFQRCLDFISKVATPSYFVLTEVESIGKFSEVRVIDADRFSVNELWTSSHLPHFNTVCFDDSACWCAFFDNWADRVCFYRRRL